MLASDASRPELHRNGTHYDVAWLQGDVPGISVHQATILDGSTFSPRESPAPDEAILWPERPVFAVDDRWSGFILHGMIAPGGQGLHLARSPSGSATWPTFYLGDDAATAASPSIVGHDGVFAYAWRTERTADDGLREQVLFARVVECSD